LKYAVSYPESIEKLILLNSAPITMDESKLFLNEINHRLEPYQKEFDEIQKKLEFAKNDPNVIKNYYQFIFARYFYDPSKINRLNLCMSSKALINGYKVFEILEQNQFSTESLHENLKHLKIPTLIIHGDDDVISTIIPQKIHEDIHDSRYILLKHCGHFPYIESPDELFQNLKSFLESK
jgi:proline iminopeptidase